MKHFYKLILFTLCVILAGCSERTLKFDREYPDTTNLDELRIKKGEEILKGKVGTEFSHLLGSNILPDLIEISYIITKNDLKIRYKQNTRPLQYCWRKTVEECAHLTPINIHINSHNLELSLNQMTKITLDRGHRITLNMFNANDETPLADDVELYILEKDGSLTPYPLSKLDKYNYAFYLPKEINSYTFMIKAIFETYIGGIAYYPVNFNLR